MHMQLAQVCENLEDAEDFIESNKIKPLMIIVVWDEGDIKEVTDEC